MRQVRTSRARFCCLFKTVTSIWGSKLREENYSSKGIVMSFERLFVCTYPGLWVLGHSSTSAARTLECEPSDVLWELAFQVQAAPTALTILFLTPSSMKSSCLWNPAPHYRESLREALTPPLCLIPRLTLLLQVWFVSICLLKYRNMATEPLCPHPTRQ